MATFEHSSSAATSGTVSRTILLLSVLLAASLAAVVVLAVVQMKGGGAAPGSGPAASPGAPAADGAAAPAESVGSVVPFVQRDTIQPLGQSTGSVYFPVPYASMPNLKLTPSDRYLVTTQTEDGFAWIDLERATSNEMWSFFREQAERLAKPAAPAAGGSSSATAPAAAGPATLPAQPPLTWEAKGIPGDPRQRPRKRETVEQSGSFTTVFGTDGEIYFPEPYASPPNVTLSGSYTESTVVTKVEATHFKWKNAGEKQTWGQGSITWTARGPKGPPEAAK